MVTNLSLTKLRDYLNENLIKKSGTKFTISDVQGYIRRGHLPKYLGNQDILLNNKFKGIKIYNVK